MRDDAPGSPEIAVSSARRVTVQAVVLSTGNTVSVERADGDQPLVVFDAGMGLSSAMWGGVVAHLEGVAWLKYDRCGLGLSPPTSLPRRLTDLADDLGALLDWCGARSVVLVGHSWGGLIARLLAAQRREQVVGLVLVDPTDEWGERVSEGQGSTRSRIVQRVGVAGARLAAAAQLGRIVSRRLARHLPEPARTKFRQSEFSSVAVSALQQELAYADGDLIELRRNPPQVDHVPLTIISGTGGKSSGLRYAQFIESHRVRARQHPNGRHVEATRSGHMIPLTEPDLVATEIGRLLASLCRP